MPESRWKPKPVCQVSGRDCSGRAQQDSPGKLMPGFVQVCGITGHNILHTGKTGEESVSPGLDIWRALRSDCLFPSKHFGGWVKELGGLGNGESYGTVKATQTHRLTTALTQNALWFKLKDQRCTSNCQQIFKSTEGRLVWLTGIWPLLYLPGSGLLRMQTQHMHFCLPFVSLLNTIQE